MENVFEIQTPTKKVIKSTLQKDITVYKFFFMPLCAILGDKSKEYWLMEHFTNIYYIKGKKDSYTWLDYLEINGFSEDVLKVNIWTYDEAKDKDIITFIKEQIDAGCFAIPYVDEFYLKGPYNGVRHLVSDVFITGYDDEKEDFIGIGYTDSFAITYIHYSYDEIRQGYASFTNGVVNINDCHAWVKDCLLSSYKLIDTKLGKIFDYSVFNNDIKRYFTSEPHKELLRPQNVKEFGDDSLFGMQAQEATLNAIMNLKNDIYKTDYRQMHLLTEHKKLLVKKFNYINEHICPIDKSILDRCKAVANNFEFARILYLKEVMKEKRLYDPLKNKIIIDRIISLMKKGISIEKEYLTDYLNL